MSDSDFTDGSLHSAYSLVRRGKKKALHKRSRPSRRNATPGPPLSRGSSTDSRVVEDSDAIDSGCSTYSFNAGGGLIASGQDSTTRRLPESQLLGSHILQRLPTERGSELLPHGDTAEIAERPGASPREESIRATVPESSGNPQCQSSKQACGGDSRAVRFAVTIFAKRLYCKRHPDGCPDIHNGCFGYTSIDAELNTRLTLGRIWSRLCSDKALAVKFGRGQLERTPTTETIHLQCYIIMQTRKRFSTIQKIIRSFDDVGRVHLESCKGTHGQNVAYVTKPDTRVDSLDPFGDDVTGEELSQGGNVGKIARLIETASGPRGISGALEELPVTGMQNIRNLQTYLHFTQKPHVGVRFNIFISGPPRCGKSRFAWSLLGLPYVKGAGKWFDGYVGEKTALFDECQTLGRITDLILKITDRYPARVEVKGGSVWFNSVVNVFTSNLSFRDALCTDKESFDVIGAIEDRFALILNVSCDRLGKPVVKLLDYIKNPTAPALISWKGASIAIDNFHASSRFPVSDLLQCMVTAGVFTEELVSSADPPTGDQSLEPDSRE